MRKCGCDWVKDCKCDVVIHYENKHPRPKGDVYCEVMDCGVLIWEIDSFVEGIKYIKKRKVKVE